MACPTLPTWPSTLSMGVGLGLRRALQLGLTPMGIATIGIRVRVGVSIRVSVRAMVRVRAVVAVGCQGNTHPMGES